MSKLRMNYTLAETALKTDDYGVWLKIVPNRTKEALVQFGYPKPASQIASVKDLRELASIFLEVAELLEGDSKPQEEAAKPENREGAAKPKKGTRTVRVELVTDANSPTLHGVFSELTDEQAEALEHAIRVMNAALPWEQRIYVTY